MTDVTQMGVWGNHSPTMYPDLFHAQGSRRAGVEARRRPWRGSKTTFLPNVGKRGAAIIEARGASSRRVRRQRSDRPRQRLGDGHDIDWVSMGVASDGSYGIPEGLICGFPCICAGGEWEIVEGLELDEFSRSKIDARVAELTERARHRQGPGPDLAAGEPRHAGGRCERPRVAAQERRGRETAPLVTVQQAELATPLARALALRVPAATLLGHLFFLLEPGQHAVQVVLLDAHLRGELGNRDARAGPARTTVPRRRACRCLCAVRRDVCLWRAAFLRVGSSSRAAGVVALRLDRPARAARVRAGAERLWQCGSIHRRPAAPRRRPRGGCTRRQPA